MNRFSISFNDQIYQKLRAQAAQKQLNLTSYVRQLVDLGLQLEELSEKNEPASGADTALEDSLAWQSKLLQKQFVAMHEVLYMTRHLLLYFNEEIENQQRIAVMETAQTKAREVLQSMQKENGILK